MQRRKNPPLPTLGTARREWSSITYTDSRLCETLVGSVVGSAQGSEKDSLKSSKSFDISASRAGFELLLPPRKGERSSRFEASPGLPLLARRAREKWGSSQY